MKRIFFALFTLWAFAAFSQETIIKLDTLPFSQENAAYFDTLRFSQEIITDIDTLPLKCKYQNYVMLNDNRYYNCCEYDKDIDGNVFAKRFYFYNNEIQMQVRYFKKELVNYVGAYRGK